MSQDDLGQRIEAARQQLELLKQQVHGTTDKPLSVEALEKIATSIEALVAAANELRRQNDVVTTDQVAEKNRRFHQQMFESAPDGYLMTDRAGSIREANQAAAAMLHVNHDSMIGESLHAFVVEGDRQVLHHQMTQLLNQDRVVSHWTIRLQARTGDAILTQLSVGPVHDTTGQAIGLRWLLHDVGERKRVEEALRQSNHEMALLNSAIQTLASTLDLRCVLINIMEELTRFLDAENCSVWLTDPATGELVCRESTGANREVVRGWRLAPESGLAGWVIRHGEGIIVADTRGDEHHYKGVDQKTGVEMRSILCAPLWVQQGVIGALEVTDTEVNHFTDADLRKVEPLAAAAATAIVNARLYERAQQEIADRKRAEEALRRHAAELLARNEELDAFAHTVAHDLKNPLSIIVGFAESLEGSYAELPPQVLGHHLHLIADSARKMGNITDELLLLAGVRKMQVLVEPLDMASIVAEARRRLTTIITAAQAEISLPDTWPVAVGHAMWVEQVWVNYISNGIKYGGEPPRLELGAEAPSPGWVRFWVRDNGHGLSPEDQARLFTPFTRLEQVRARGHGLGLSIVRRIVEKLGGQVGVESQIGRGSTFFFTLPGAEPDRP